MSSKSTFCGCTPSVSHINEFPCSESSNTSCELFRCMQSGCMDTDVVQKCTVIADCQDRFGRLQDAGTVYFNESADGAKQLVGETLDRWHKLLESLPSEEKQSLVRSMGLKMEQLKAELAELDHLHDDD